MLKNCLRIMLFLAFLSAATSPTFACNLPAGSGFIILSIFDDFVLSPFGVESPIPEQHLEGKFVSGDNIGSRSFWEEETDEVGELTRLGFASPATWAITYVSGPCSPQDPIDANGSTFEYQFAASSTPQKIFCNHVPSFFIQTSPSSFDNSTGQSQFTVTMTSTSEPWPSTPYTYYVYDINGNQLSTGSVTVTDSYNCWATMILGAQSAATQYIGLADYNGVGVVGYATITVTDGNGGSG